eukprot:7440739-Alexandrium_andersonii.AAC.1
MEHPRLVEIPCTELRPHRDSALQSSRRSDAELTRRSWGRSFPRTDRDGSSDSSGFLGLLVLLA